MRVAVIRTATGLVENVVLVEPGASWSPPPGCFTRDAAGAGPGETWDGTKFLKAPKPAATPAELALLAARDNAASGLVSDIDKAFTARGAALTATEKADLKGKVIDLLRQ